MTTASVVSDIALPIEMVELKHLRTKSGEPVRVKCESVAELVIAEILKALPGERPGGVQEPQSEEEALSNLKNLSLYCPPIIEVGTSFVDADGNEVRPAFYWDESKRHPLSIPGRLLREEDKMRLLESVMRLSGYIGGAAEATFHDGVGEGRESGVGAVEAGDSIGPDSVGGV